MSGEMETILLDHLANQSEQLERLTEYVQLLSKLVDHLQRQLTAVSLELEKL